MYYIRKMCYLTTFKYLSVFILISFLSKGISAECIHEKPQWFMQFGLRETPSSAKSNQRITGSHSEIEPFQKYNNVQPIDENNIPEDKTNEDVKNSPLPLVSLGSKYYYFGTYFKTNFFQAMQFCEDHGMNLLSIESKAENDNILNHLKKNFAKLDHIWTSGTDLGLEGDFVWLSTGKHLNFTNWSPPQPDNAGKVENCLEIWKLKDSVYIWNDIVCTNNYNFICELKECSNFCANT